MIHFAAAPRARTVSNVTEVNPAAPVHLPAFIAVPGQSDWLMTFMLFFSLAAVVSVGLPEHMAHRTAKTQPQFVAVLVLFIHNHIFWIAVLPLTLRAGYVVNPMVRPAGIIVPDRQVTGLDVAFGQIEAHVIPVVIRDVHDVIASGQTRPTDHLRDTTNFAQPCTMTALEAFALHAIDATGLVHAALRRMLALIQPVRTLVSSGGY